MPFIDGLLSGLDTTKIIADLLAIESRPLVSLQKRVTTQQQEKTALLDVSARLLALESRSKTLATPSFFGSTSVSSSSDSLSATGEAVAATGSFAFTPKAMARAGLSISHGFSDRTSKPGAGVLTLALGNGFLAKPTSLDSLNGGTGIDRGLIKITDKAGASDMVDLSGTLNVEEVLDRINTSSVSVEAMVSGDSIALIDSSGGTGLLSVEEVGGKETAESLGILGSTSDDFLFGMDIIDLTESTGEMQLNDGLGVRRGSSDDLKFTMRDGTVFTVDIGDSESLGEIITKINTDADNPGTLLAKIGADGNRIVIEDSTGVDGTLTVASVGSLKTAEDLGIAGSISGAAADETLIGGALISGLNSTLLKVLKGTSGAGVDLSTFEIKDKSGATEIFDISSAETVQDVIEILNGGAIVAISAGINSAGNGILLEDKSGSTSDLLTVTEGVGSTAADLGILTDPSGVEGDELDSGDLKRQYISERTKLSSLNQGQGVAKGKLEIVDSHGAKAVIDLRQVDDDRIEDVIEEIIGGVGSITAKINDEGTGLALFDETGGSSKIVVREVGGGSMAKDLNILGESDSLTPNGIDGGFTVSLTLDGTEDLDGVVKKINALDMGLTATVIDTGSGPTPYRISIISKDTGADNRLLVDSSEFTSLSFAEATRARDSALLFGSSSSAFLVSDSDNEIDGLVEGLTLSIKGVSTSPVTVTVSRDDEALVSQVGSFVEKFNDSIRRIGELTDYNTAAEVRPVLFADGTLRRIESRLYTELLRPVSSAGKFTVASQLGISVERNGLLSFKAADLRDALKEDAASVEKFFTAEKTGLGVRLDKMLKEVNHVKDGSITHATVTRDRIVEDLNKQIERMQDSLASKSDTLRREFANLELIISQTQNELSRLSSQFGSLGGGGGGGGLL